MYLIPLNQIESVELVIHALRAAAGEADCSSCPAHRVCMKQCLTIAESVERMIAEGVMPSFATTEQESDDVDTEPAPCPDDPPPAGGGHLKIIK